MMAKILTCVFLFVYLSCFAQESKVISSFDSKNSSTLLNGQFNQIINSEKSDTSYFVSIKYKKAKGVFQHDTVSILFTKKRDWDQFVGDLTVALDNFDKMEDWVRMTDTYRMSVYKRGKTLYLGQSIEDGGAYTFLNKKEAIGLINWSQKITMK